MCVRSMLKFFWYFIILLFINFNIVSDNTDDYINDGSNIENQENEKKYNFRFSTTKNELFNKVDSKLFAKIDFCLLNSAYISEIKSLGKYSSLKLDKPLIDKYLSFNNFIGFKIKKDKSIGIRFGSAGFGAGNLIQYNLVAGLSCNLVFFTKKSFSMDCELGVGFYFLESKNEKLKRIIDVVHKNNIEVFTDRIFINVIYSFYWNFIGISIGGPIALKFLNANTEKIDIVQRLISAFDLALSDDLANKKQECDYLIDKLSSRFISFLDFLNIRLSLNIMDLTKFILQKTNK